MSGVFGVRNQLMELVKAFDDYLYYLNGSETSLICWLDSWLKGQTDEYTLL